MMMARIQAVYQIVDELNKELRSSRDIKFHVSEGRTSLSDLRSKGIIDYAKVDRNNVLNVHLMKNMDDLPESEWRKAIKDLPNTLSSKLDKADINTTYSWSKGKYLGITNLNADIDERWGDTPNQAHGAMRTAFDKVDVHNVNKLYDLKDDQDPTVASNGARAANFVKFIKSGPTVVVPKSLWRSMGWSDQAIKMKVLVKYPELGSSILAVLRSDFEKVVGALGFKVTENEAPLLHKDSYATNVNVPKRSLSLADEVTKMYHDIRVRVETSSAYGAFGRNIADAKKRGDVEAMKRINKQRDDYASREINRLVKTPEFETQMIELSEKYKSNPNKVAADILNYHKSLVKDNMDIIDNKLIQIFKNPRYQYFQIRSVSGVSIPSY